MQWLDLTLATAEQNLALDEALLLQAESSDSEREVLRFWEPDRPAVVLGSSSHVATEARIEVCAQREIPILRRSSGGAAILTGPGCLMYAVVLSYRKRPHLRPIDATHRFVLDTVLSAIRTRVPGVERAGTSDLVLDGRKFSGNSLRCKRDHLLYHGTLLYNFRLAQIAECLGRPAREPHYRAGRGHDDFVMNLPLSAETLKQSLASVWEADDEMTDWPRTLVEQLVREKFSQPSWNRRL